MNIPDEAVEAAAATYWNRHYRSSADPEWIDAATAATRADETEQVRNMMRQSLESAAPFIRAQTAAKIAIDAAPYSHPAADAFLRGAAEGYKDQIRTPHRSQA